MRRWINYAVFPLPISTIERSRGVEQSKDRNITLMTHVAWIYGDHSLPIPSIGIRLILPTLVPPPHPDMVGEGTRGAESALVGLVAQRTEWRALGKQAHRKDQEKRKEVRMLMLGGHWAKAERDLLLQRCICSSVWLEHITWGDLGSGKDNLQAI